jgi:mono/diheme cytochrome c family protein
MRRRITTLLVLLLPLAALATGPADAPPPTHLRDTGLFADAEGTQLAPGVLAYSPQYPLWSDGATKRRWIRLPPRTTIDARDPDAWVFPVGTRLWKEFTLGRRVETRMLERTRRGWRYATYVWSEDGTDAVLAPEDGIPGVAIGSGATWTIPGEADCRACHEGQKTPVLGFTALQLSSDRDPGAVHADSPGIELDGLIARGLLSRAPQSLLTAPPRIAARSADERSALGYLHANCGICHNSQGPLASLGMDLLYRPSEGTASADRIRASLLDARAVRAHGSAELRIRSGNPEHSLLVQRMRSRDAFTQMPPLGTRTSDREALTLVERWIQNTSPRSPP